MDEQAPHESTISITINNNNPQKISKNVTITKEPSASSSILIGLHAGYFRICLSLGSQVLLWSNLSENLNPTHSKFHSHTLPSVLFVLLWWLSFCTLILLSTLYLLRCVFYSHLVKNEFLHHVGINFLFIPLISWLLLLQATPSLHLDHIYGQNLLWVFVVPIVILDIKIYGQWITTEKRFLSMLANPTSQLSVIGNLAGAWAAAQMGWKESGVSIFTLGLAHYLVVFVTLYQRLHGASRFPVMLRPELFLFVAAPSIASLGWTSISSSFGLPCKMLFFLSLFLFTSLICRPVLFKKSMKRFNMAWWSYSFPLTFLALASVEYAEEVKGVVASTLMLILSTLSVLVFLGIMVFTILDTDRLLRGKLSLSRLGCHCNYKFTTG